MCAVYLYVDGAVCALQSAKPLMHCWWLELFIHYRAAASEEIANFQVIGSMHEILKLHWTRVSIYLTAGSSIIITVDRTILRFYEGFLSIKVVLTLYSPSACLWWNVYIKLGMFKAWDQSRISVVHPHTHSRLHFSLVYSAYLYRV